MTARRTPTENTLMRVAARLVRAADIWNELAATADDKEGARFVREARGARRDARSLVVWVAEMQRRRGVDV